MNHKKHPSGNEYIVSGNVWIRNFTKGFCQPLQLTNLFQESEYNLILRNEESNKNYPKISDEKLAFKKVLIVSDGYDFDKKQYLIKDMPKDVCILAINKALSKWQLYSYKTPLEDRRSINAFIVNNPYKETMKYLPPKDAKYFPTCIASIRTNYDFVKKYPGSIYTYFPTPEQEFGYARKQNYFIDDYRNPICAAIGLAYQFGAEKIMLFCCDDSFEDKREFAVKLPNNLYTYPQHIMSQEIIDGNLYWLTHQEEKEVTIVDYSSGKEYVNATYISSEEEAILFFKEDEDGTQNE